MVDVVATTDAPTSDGSMFEGLTRMLKPEGAFADDLRAVGYDIRNPQLSYPTGVLVDVLDVAARHVYPELTREEAHRLLGQRFVDSYLDTILGKVFGTLVRVLGMEGFLTRMPKMTAMGSSGHQVTVQKPAPGEIHLTFRSSSRYSPDFIAGAFESGCRLTRSNLRVEVLRRDPGEFEILVTRLGQPEATPMVAVKLKPG